MDLEEIQQKQLEFINKMKWERFNASQIFVHLIEELGEIGKHVLYQERYKVKGAGHSGTTSEIAQEFAQSFNLFLQLAIQLEVNLDQAWQSEHKRNLERFDPEQWKRLAEEDELNQ